MNILMKHGFGKDLLPLRHLGTHFNAIILKMYANMILKKQGLLSGRFV
jgi:hypothetical protein